MNFSNYYYKPIIFATVRYTSIHTRNIKCYDHSMRNSTKQHGLNKSDVHVMTIQNTIKNEAKQFSVET